jgi:hypothetical protein
MADLKCFFVEGNNDPEDSEIIFAKSSIEAKRWWANEYGDGDRCIAGISAKRRPEWDEHAPGPVPSLELLDAGWWMECHGCGVRIDQDAIGTSEPYTDGYTYEDFALDREYGPDLTLPICQPVEPKPGVIYCNDACHARHDAERKRIKRMEAKALAIVRAHVLRRFPGVTIDESDRSGSHVYVNRDRCGALLIVDVRVGFKCPGMKYGATFAVRDEKWRHSHVIDGRPWEPSDGYHTRTKRNRAPLSQRKRDVELWVANGDKETWEAWHAGIKAEAEVHAA